MSLSSAMCCGCRRFACVGVKLLLMTVLMMYLEDSAAARSEPELLQMQFAHRTGPSSRPCKINCTSSRVRHVCGTDGRTYDSKCEIKRLRRCEGRNVNLLQEGRCPTSTEGTVITKCVEDRRQAEAEALRSESRDTFVPVCRPDGSFAQVQCHQTTGYCWCVTPDGKPIASTSVQGERPSCSRSPEGKIAGRRGAGKRRNRKNRRGVAVKGCPPLDRAAFNTNLINLFSQEFARIPKPSKAPTLKELPIQSESDSLLDTPEKRVIEWKFSELDLNKDNVLRRKEIRDLKKMVKKLVKPRPCARNFDNYCDIGKDRSIDRGEWSVCLGVDINKEQLVSPGSSSSSRKDSRKNAGMLKPDEPSSTRTTILDLIDRKSKPTFLIPRDEEDKSDEDTGPSEIPKTCDQEHRQALENDRADPQGGIFIPDCASGGLYKKEQCHKSTQFCWCVDEQTGKPIPGTSTHKVKPDCTDKIHRPMKGCPYVQKKVFLTELLDSLTTQMANANDSDSRSKIEDNPDYSLEERAVRWKLKMLDKNKSGTLERKELKGFKSDIKRAKRLRKCGRNFIKYCDANEDNTLTLEEWINCMGVKEQKRNLPDLKREGPNPFHKFLKGGS